MNNRQLFQQHIAQTSPTPMGIEIVRASGTYLYDVTGKAYLDAIGGISVCNIGHSNLRVIEAVQQQAAQYMHVMVYGEVVQSPQVHYGTLLAQYLPEQLSCIYFTNSGSEATDGAIKLARRCTGRTDIICCNNSYHGHTIGALSVMGDEYWRNAFRPLLPGVWHYDYNSEELLNAINGQTACVIVETIQAEAGVVEPANNWLARLRRRCDETGTLLILDEIQCGFGRTGKLWGFEHYGVVPDIVLLGKALGGGMPMGAFISSHSLMAQLTHDPVLGHITTFGGHPVCSAAGMAAMRVLLDDGIIYQIAEKEAKFHELLKHPAIVAVRSKGLLMAIELADTHHVRQVLERCLERGLFSDWFLFAPHCIRIAPPLTISIEEIEEACAMILASL